MNKHFPVILYVFVVISIVSNAQTQWTELKNVPDSLKELASVNGQLFGISHNGLYKSLDNGNSWEKVPISLSAGNLFALDSEDGNLYIAVSNGVIKFEPQSDTLIWLMNWHWDSNVDVDFVGDIGYTVIRNWGSLSGPNIFVDNQWQLIRGTPPNDITQAQKNTSRVVASPLDPAIAFVEGQSQTYRTLDSGNNWYEVPNKVIYSSVTNSQVYFWGQFNFSVDNGETWANIDGLDNSTSFRRAISFASEGDSVFLSVSDGGVFLGRIPNLDNLIPIGLKNIRINHLFAEGGFLFAITEQGNLFRIRVDLIVSDNSNLIHSELFSVKNISSQFFEGAEIELNTSQSGPIQIKIFDLSGRLIRIFEKRFSSGFYKVRLGKSDLGRSGLFFLRLEMGDVLYSYKKIVIPD